MPKLPKIRLTIHAEMRIFERLVDLNNIKRAIDAPDDRSTDPYGKVLVRKKIEERILFVVYSKQFRVGRNEYLIVTFYYKDI